MRKTPADFIKVIEQQYPEVRDVLELAATHVKDRKQAIQRYQAAILYMLARKYDGQQATVVELGTRKGYSAAVLAQALPDARIFTCEPHIHYAVEAGQNLQLWPHVEVVNAYSWDFVKKANDGRISLVFVDGDHEQVKRDMAWWAKVKPGGCMIFHDYNDISYPAVVQAVESIKKPDEVFERVHKPEGMAVIYK